MNENKQFKFKEALIMKNCVPPGEKNHIDGQKRKTIIFDRETMYMKNQKVKQLKICICPKLILAFKGR